MDLDLFRALLDEVPHGVVLLDGEGRVVHYNRAEEKLARRSRESVLGKSFFEDVAPCMNTEVLAGQFHAKIGRAALDVEAELRFPFPFLEGPRAVALRMSSFALSGRHFGCLFIQDVSAAHALAEMRESLTSMVVHDLKNPLSVIRANLDYLSELPALTGDAEALLSLEESGAAERRLHAMILTLLDLARLERGTMPVRRGPVDVGVLVDGCVRQMRPLGRARQLRLSADLPEAAMVLSIDGDLIGRALGNLLENAVRFARPGGEVRVVLAPRPAAVTIEVWDDGPGIPAELRERIFQPFVTGAAAPGDSRGLGLAFVDLAARAHGGSAEVTCPPGGGSVFAIQLPLGP